MDKSFEDGQLQALVNIAIDEDFGDTGDITAQATIDISASGSFVLRSRESGILSGVEVANATIKTIDRTLEINWLKNDGDILSQKEDIATISGNLRSILQAERVVLNFLSHLSGVATQTKSYVDKLRDSGSKTIIRDTRKTTPGFRSLEKAAVSHGGAQNHRMGLFDAFLIKDNHLSFTSIEEAIKRCRQLYSKIPIEVEVDSIDQLVRVIDLKPDLVLLDNFDVSQVVEAIAVAPNMKFEISGGVNIDNLVEYGSTNVDFIAVGALTHSVRALDIGLDEL